MDKYLRLFSASITIQKRNFKKMNRESTDNH